MDAKLSNDKLALPSFTLGHGAGALLAIALVALLTIYVLFPLLSLVFSLIFWLLVGIGLVLLIWAFAPTVVIGSVSSILSFINRSRD